MTHQEQMWSVPFISFQTVLHPDRWKASHTCQHVNTSALPYRVSSRLAPLISWKQATVFTQLYGEHFMTDINELGGREWTFENTVHCLWSHWSACPNTMVMFRKVFHAFLQFRVPLPAGYWWVERTLNQQPCCDFFLGSRLGSNYRYRYCTAWQCRYLIAKPTQWNGQALHSILQDW